MEEALRRSLTENFKETSDDVSMKMIQINLFYVAALDIYFNFN